MDAANVDLKAFSDEFYFKLTGARLQPVLDTLVYLVRETPVWVEITTLLIPTKNDSEDELRRMSAWIAGNLGPHVPLHFTAFHPDYKMTDIPATPARDAGAGPGNRAVGGAAVRLHRQRPRRGRHHPLPRLPRARHRPRLLPDPLLQA
jgi:pyruvate-formate lyase-activating enzyme